jgi:hypothetical protein
MKLDIIGTCIEVNLIDMRWVVYWMSDWTKCTELAMLGYLQAEPAGTGTYGHIIISLTPAAADWYRMELHNA